MCMGDSFTGLWYGFPSSDQPAKKMAPAKEAQFVTPAFWRLERDFDGELNLACRSAGLGQDPRGAQRPGAIENVRVVGGYRWSEIGMIEDVKDLRSKLDVEIL